MQRVLVFNLCLATNRFMNSVYALCIPGNNNHPRWNTTVERCVASKLKGLSYEIFGPVLWTLWMYLGLNVNHLWFFNFNDAPLIWDNYFKFWPVSGQTFSETLRIPEKDWQLSLWFSNFRRLLVSGSPRNRWKYFSENHRISENCYTLSPRGPYEEYKRMVLEHTHGLFIT